MIAYLHHSFKRADGFPWCDSIMESLGQSERRNLLRFSATSCFTFRLNFSIAYLKDLLGLCGHCALMQRVQKVISKKLFKLFVVVISDFLWLLRTRLLWTISIYRWLRKRSVHLEARSREVIANSHLRYPIRSMGLFPIFDSVSYRKSRTQPNFYGIHLKETRYSKI